MRAFMFPGQGSQFKGMGCDLFQSSRMFLPLERQIDALAGFSVRQMCLEADDATLRRTDITQPCLYIVNALSLERQRALGVVPQFLVGHSLGEINALQAAGAFDLLTGLRIVVERGRLMALEREGGMAAVIGLAVQQVEAILGRSGLNDLDVANVNSSSQVVLSGPKALMENAKAYLVESGASAFIPLDVGAAFHSRYMQRAADAFDGFLRDAPMRATTTPVISNVTAQPYPTDGDAEAQTRHLLVRQITSMVRWDLVMNHLREHGVSEFIEVGPGTVLSRLSGRSA